MRTKIKIKEELTGVSSLGTGRRATVQQLAWEQEPHHLAPNLGSGSPRGLEQVTSSFLVSVYSPVKWEHLPLGMS